MSEHLKPSHGGEQLKAIDTGEIQKKHAESLKEQAERSSHEHKENISNIAKQVEQHAISGKEQHKTGSEDGAQQNHYLVNGELKGMAYQRLLTRTRKRLSKPDKVLSKIVHNTAVDRVSDVASKTIARPSGVLGGSMVAFFGTTAFLYIARHYGFQYNYLLFIFLLAGGFALGMIIELALHYLKRSSR